MISCSCGHHEESLQLSSVAERSTPMMGTDRSNLFCRTLLFLIVLLGVPLAVRADTLEDSARELAGKIAAALPAKDNVSFEIRNVSSLQLDEVARIGEALKTDLQNEGFPAHENSGATARILITLSENLNNFVWAAEVRQGDSSQVVFTMIPRPGENIVASSAMPITLHSDKFWEGPENILDAAEVNSSNGASLLLLLQPDGLIIRNKGGDSTFKVEIPPAQVATRIPFGSFVHIGNPCQSPEFASCVTAMFDSRICEISLDKRTLVECHVEGPAGHQWLNLFYISPSPLPLGRNRPLGPIQSHCGGGTQFLSTGIGDYTQSDSIQALDDGNGPVSSELDFPGPILAIVVLVDDPTNATVVVRNLKSLNYEAYRLSISCVQ
jgi:hypothetical protein